MVANLTLKTKNPKVCTVAHTSGSNITIAKKGEFVKFKPAFGLG